MNKKTDRKKQTVIPKESKLVRNLSLLIFVLAFLLYGNTIGHHYVLDDIGLAVNNTTTEQGITAIPTIFSTGYRSSQTFIDHEFYRPIPKAVHAIMWQLAPGNPTASHLINVLLYAITCSLLFYLLMLLLKGNLILSFLTTILFITHPIHTEVVANIKSIDEILCFLFFIVLAISFFKYYVKHQPTYQWIGFAAFVLALLSKESAILFVILVPLIFFFFTELDYKKILFIAFKLGVIATLFVILRHQILGINNAVIEPTTNSLVLINDNLLQKANSIFLLGVYLFQLVLPYSLLSEASFNHFSPVGFADYQFLLPLVIIIGILVYSIINFNKKGILSFAVLFFFISILLTSNLIFIIGTNYAERFLYLPSLGFCLAFAFSICTLTKPKMDGQQKSSDFWQMNKTAFLITILIGLLFSVRTITRNQDWFNSRTLFEQEVNTAPNCARLQCYYASAISNVSYLNTMPKAAGVKFVNQAIESYKKAIEIYPKFHQAYSSLAEVYGLLGNVAAAETCYIKATLLKSTEANYFNNYGNFLFQLHRYDEAGIQFDKAIKVDSLFPQALNNRGSVFGVKGNMLKQSADSLFTLGDSTQGNVYLQRANTQFLFSIPYFESAIKKDPTFAMPHKYLAVTLAQLGQIDKSNAEYLKDQALNKKKPKLNYMKMF